MQQPMGLILAGGRGSRMGGADKAALMLAGAPLIAHVAARLGPQADGLVVSANGDPLRPVLRGHTVLGDADPGFPGPLAGILAGLDHAAGLGIGAVVSAAVDTPFLPPDLVPQLLLAGGGGLALARTAQGPHPTFGLWPVSLRAALRDYLAAGGRRVRGFALDHGSAFADFAAGPPDPFFNINTPEDLAIAEGLLVRAAPG